MSWVPDAGGEPCCIQSGVYRKPETNKHTKTKRNKNPKTRTKTKDEKGFKEEKSKVK